MKVRITNDMKKSLTVAEIAAVRKIISDMKEISHKDFLEDVKNAFSLAMEKECVSNFEILKAESEIAKNARSWDCLEEGYNLDIWVTAYGYNQYYGFLELGFYLSDFWQRDDVNKDEIRYRMYVRKCPFAEKSL